MADDYKTAGKRLVVSRSKGLSPQIRPRTRDYAHPLNTPRRRESYSTTRSRAFPGTAAKAAPRNGMPIIDLVELNLPYKREPCSTLYSAIPDGYEIWAVTRMRGQFSEVRFLSTDRMRRKANPDLFAAGRYIEIKTPEHSWNISEILHGGYLQCENRGHDGGTVILSPLRLKEGLDLYADYAMAKTARMRRNGKGCPYI